MFVSSFARIICEVATEFSRILTPHGGSKSVRKIYPYLVSQFQPLASECRGFPLAAPSDCTGELIMAWRDFVPLCHTASQAKRFVVSCDAFICSLFQNTFVLLLSLEHVVIRIFNNTKYDNAHFVLLFNEFLKRCTQNSNSAV
jgi:hypothetical protein